MGAIIRILAALAVVCAIGAAPAMAQGRAATAIGTVQTAGKRVALVIGNSNYQHAPILPNPANDADAMAVLLRSLGFEVVEGLNVDKRAFEERIVDFSEKADDAAVTLFYYAGHGMQVDGRNYLLPVDAALEKKASLPFQTVAVDTVLGLMTARNRIAIALLDACRDNPLSRSFAMTRSVGGSRGLALPDAGGGGIMIGFATAPGDTAADGEGRHSPFAAALLRHLGEPGIEIGQSMKHVMADVSASTNDRQRPWIHSDISDDFYMRPAPGQEADSAAVSQPPAVVRDGSESENDDGTDIAARQAEPLTAREQAAPAPSLAIKTFGVFENQTFDLCGYSEFHAAIGNNGGSGREVSISSLDRSIPGRSFRGYRKSLPLETPVQLWNNCTVKVSYNNRAGVTRFVFSVSGGR